MKGYREERCMQHIKENSNFIIRHYKAYIGVCSLVMLVVLAVECLLNYIADYSNMVRCGHTGFQMTLFYNNIYIITYVALFIIGLIATLKDFSIIMSIKADRKQYLVTLLLQAIISTIIFLALTKILIGGFVGLSKEAMPLAGNITVTSTLELFEQYLIVTGVMAFTGGALVGCIFYRFKVLTASVIIGFFPAIMLLSMVLIILFNISVAWMILRTLLFGLNLMLSLWGQILYIGVGSLIIYCLIIRAPIKNYARDLLY